MNVIISIARIYFMVLYIMLHDKRIYACVALEGLPFIDTILPIAWIKPIKHISWWSSVDQ